MTHGLYSTHLVGHVCNRIHRCKAPQSHDIAYGTDFAGGTGVANTLVVRVTATTTADAVAAPVAYFAVGCETAVVGGRTLASATRPASFAIALTADASAVSGADLAVVTRAVEVVALAESSRNLLVGILQRQGVSTE
jgi:hypothetical protein